MSDDADFGNKQTPRETLIEVQGAGIGIVAWLAIGFVGALLAGFTAIIAGAETPTLFLSVFGGILGMAFFSNLHRSQHQSITINEETVTVASGEIAKSDIFELFVKNPDGHNVCTARSENGSLVFGTGLTGAAIVGTAAMGNALNKVISASTDAMNNSIAQRDFSVCVRHERKVTSLARFLSEDDAIALFARISKAF